MSEERIAILAAPGDDPRAILEEFLPEAWGWPLASDGPSLAKTIRGAQILLVADFRSGALREAWPAARSLEWIHAMSAGVDTLLFPELADSDVTLTNARGVFDHAMAEYALGLMLAMAKDFRRTFELQSRGIWEHRETETISGKNLLVVGAGSIGESVARLCRSMCMNVRGIARRERPKPGYFAAVGGPGALLEWIGEAHYIVVTAPLTAATRGMIGAAELARVRSGARLVNLGRGALVDEPALLAALREGRLAGAALDVFNEEPLPPGHPFWTEPGVIVSPHMSGDYKGWRRELAWRFAENLRRRREGKPLRDVVEDKRAAMA